MDSGVIVPHFLSNKKTGLIDGRVCDFFKMTACIVSKWPPALTNMHLDYIIYNSCIIYRSRNDGPVSGVKRKAAYIAMFILAAFLIGMIALFFVL